MTEGIFLIQDGELVVLNEAPYESEKVLQDALTDFPEVLAGGLTSGDGEARLVLVKAEQGVPMSDGAAATLSLDHLFIDSLGIPVIVEVKRSSDTRIRREVVAQMLDYAANGVKYWPVAELRANFETTAATKGQEPSALLKELAPEIDEEDFWTTVADNLHAGRIRMVFVADHLPDELVRIIEFLNEQMSPAEVLGVEVPQFTDGTTRVLVPRVVGATTAAKVAKERGGGTPWNETTFLAAAAERCTQLEVEMMQTLLHHAADHGSKLSWGKGISPGVSGWYDVNGTVRAVWTLNAGTGGPSSSARISLYMPEIHALATTEQAESFVHALAGITAFGPGVKVATNKYPSVAIKTMSSGDFVAFLNAVEQLGTPNS